MRYIDGKPEDVPKLLREIKKQAELYQLIYKDRTIQIQILPMTYDFIKMYLIANENAVFTEEESERENKEEKLFGFQLHKNRWLHGRYAIAVLEEEEEIWTNT